MHDWIAPCSQICFRKKLIFESMNLAVEQIRRSGISIVSVNSAVKAAHRSQNNQFYGIREWSEHRPSALKYVFYVEFDEPSTGSGAQDETTLGIMPPLRNTSIRSIHFATIYVIITGDHGGCSTRPVLSLGRVRNCSQTNADQKIPSFLAISLWRQMMIDTRDDKICFHKCDANLFA